MNTLILAAIAVLIATRLLSMAAYSAWGQRVAALRMFHVDRWIMFRALLLITGVAIATYAIAGRAWGHGLGNGALAIFTLLPRRYYRASALRTQFHNLMRTRQRRISFFVIGAISCGTLAAVTAPASEALAEVFQGAGGWLLVTAMFAMMMELWGPRSAAAWPFVGLCLLFDSLLLLGAILLANQALVVLEIVTLVIEVSLAVAKLRQVGSAHAEPADTVLAA
jgi:hypothetical protein